MILHKTLKEAEPARVNAGLDALNSEVYGMITGVDAFEKAISGIKKAAEANLTLVKINTVLLKGQEILF